MLNNKTLVESKLENMLLFYPTLERMTSHSLWGDLYGREYLGILVE